MKNFLRETKELIASQGTIAIIAILQVSITAKILGPSKYGLIAIYIAITATAFRLLSSRNSDIVLLYTGEEKKINTNYFFKLESLLGIISFSLTIFIFFAFDNYLNLSFNQYSLVIIIFVFSRIFLNFTEIFKGYFTHLGNLKLFSYFESGTIVLRFVLIVSFIFLSPTIEMYFIALSIYSFTSGIISIIFIKKYEKPIIDSGLKFKEFFYLIKDSFFKIRIDQAIGVVPINLDILVLGSYLDTFSVGLYQFAKKLIEPINYLYVAFSPWMLNKLKNENDYKFSFLTKNVLIPTSILLTTLYVFGGELLITTIGSKEFLNSYQPMLIMLIGNLFFLLTFWSRHYLLINNEILAHTKGRLLNSLTFVILSILLIDEFSVNGVAIAISVGIIVQKLFELNSVFRIKKTN